MTLYLAGGAPEDLGQEIVDDFCEELDQTAQRVAIVLAASQEDGHDQLIRYSEPIRLRLPEVKIEPIWLADARVDRPLLPEDFDQISGLIVGAGPTEEYIDALVPRKKLISRIVRSNIPYLGWSAGAMIVGNHVVAGGWHYRDRIVAPEIAGEGSYELDIRPGLGLIGPAVETHADTQQLLTRAIAVSESSPVRTVLAIDEDSYVSVDVISGRAKIKGPGYLTWIMQSGEQWVIVRESQTARRNGRESKR